MPRESFTFSTNHIYQSTWLYKTIGLTLHVVFTSLSMSCCSKSKQFKNVFSSGHLTLWEKVGLRYITKVYSHSWKVLFVHRAFGVRCSVAHNNDDKQRYKQIVQENNVLYSWNFSKRESMRIPGLILKNGR